MNTAKVLRSGGVDATVRPVRNLEEINRLLVAERPTHLVINALWLPSLDLATLVHHNPHVSFAVLVHSNIGFLQVEAKAIGLLREAVDIEQSSLGNFMVAANSRAASQGIRDAWESPCLYLPNLYYLDNTVRPHRPKWSGGTLRIGAFGAQRPQKNPVGSAFAALAIATNLGTNLEFHINVGRNDGGWSDRLVTAVEKVIGNLPHAKLVKNTWEPWSGFRRLVRHMHLLLQPSWTESFNVTVGDGVAEGVASAASDVIEWTPVHWRCRPDDTNDIARVGRTLLSDSHTGQDGVEALLAHDADGVRRWQAWLDQKIV